MRKDYEDRTQVSNICSTRVLNGSNIRAKHRTSVLSNIISNSMISKGTWTTVAPAAGMEDIMSALAWEAPQGYAASPRPERPHLRLVPTGVSVGRDPEALRLTRRGRLVLTLVVAAAVLGFGMVGYVGSPAPPAPSITVTVQPGQTLSEIAAAQTSGYASVREAVAAIQIANNLPTSQVNAGQRIVVPQG
jgi:hypothetical protein